jgi:signal transduction histidine kinase
MSAQSTVLYIEDDRGSQHLVRRVLESHGYRVFLAAEGLEGILTARQEHPHLVLMDINLPGMNGREITTRLRGISGFQDIPIVALTANSEPNAREQALAAGCNGFLTKPIDIAHFPQEIQAYLTGRNEQLPEREHLELLEQHAQDIVLRLEDKIRELEAANRYLRELDQVKSNIITLVSHELRTPLTLVAGYAHILSQHLQQAETDTYPESFYELAQGMENGVNRMSKVIGEIVYISRIASGTLELAPVPVQVGYIVKMVMRKVRSLTQNRELELHISGLEALPTIEADSIHLRVAIKNVVENAIKFTPDSGTISLHGHQPDPNMVELIIQDSGIGIPPEELDRIFDPFHVLGAIEHHTTSKSEFRGGGLGLGLPIARGIIEAHHGHIGVESSQSHSDEPSGSRFYIHLPISQPG